MKHIRQRANAVTLLAVMWTIFSGLSLWSCIESWDKQTRVDLATGMVFAGIMLAIHAALIYYALHLWKTEMPTPTSAIHPDDFTIDDLIDIELADIDLPNEMRRLQMRAIADIWLFIILASIVWFTDAFGSGQTPAGRMGTTILFGVVLTMHTLSRSIRYFILRLRVQRSKAG